MHLSRRHLLTSAAVGAGAAALGTTAFGAVRTGEPAAAAAPRLPDPATSGIDHIVVVMMENRSFDHFLGWLPNADGKQAGLVFTDRQGIKHRTFHQTAYASCGFNDPDHSYEGGRIELDGGRCDGWLRAGSNDVLSISYFQQPDLAFLGKAATAWTTFDRYFSAVMAETYPNRFYQHAAQTDRIHNSTTTSTLPTIWDSLAAAGLTGRYYFSDVPFTALWGSKYVGISQPVSAFYADAAAGRLPQVSFIDPRFEDEDSGTSSDDHPHADIRAGETFLNQVYEAVVSSPNWPNTMLVINFDEWGGFFDHVAPGSAPDVSPTTALRGFRVPALVVSPRARRGVVDHTVYDHTSVLRAIEWRWGLPALTPRDAAAANIVQTLDFGHSPNLTAPRFTVPPFTPTVCTPGAVAGPEKSEWSDLKALAIQLGWSLPS
ncbi:alkaline phosphatase family protein [Amnibacterium sp. CER49]|uniref:alkaline phosphatase family protein n=1 Tax=Amnibacterium sp. CER49 TaxID=3039161 RepID=UPI002446F059|nr:alkaline phosphatase family protein [Amnibacterium sp. CER49]MDH2444093.1 alkaline phosphatase family protein [Amnibacterium sp. CER49]